jgi:hypothetical protein
MTYFQRLHPWCIIRTLPGKILKRNSEDFSGDQQHEVIARFRDRDDAVAYLKLLPNPMKQTKLMIIFNPLDKSMLPNTMDG